MDPDDNLPRDAPDITFDEEMHTRTSNIMYDTIADLVKQVNAFKHSRARMAARMGEMEEAFAKRGDTPDSARNKILVPEMAAKIETLMDRVETLEDQVAEERSKREQAEKEVAAMQETLTKELDDAHNTIRTIKHNAEMAAADIEKDRQAFGALRAQTQAMAQNIDHKVNTELKEMQKWVTESIEKNTGATTDLVNKIASLFTVFDIQPQALAKAAKESKPKCMKWILDNVPVFKHLNELIEKNREDAHEAVIETRSRIVGKLDVTVFNDFKKMMTLENEKTVDEQQRLKQSITRLEKDKADNMRVMPLINELKQHKADSADLAGKMDVSQGTVFRDQMNRMADDLNAVWERLDNMPQQEKRMSRGSFGQSVTNNLEMLKLRLNAVEAKAQDHTAELERLEKVKMDRSAMKDIYSFLDAVTHRIDSLGMNFAELGRKLDQIRAAAAEGITLPPIETTAATSQPAGVTPPGGSGFVSADGTLRAADGGVPPPTLHQPTPPSSRGRDAPGATMGKRLELHSATSPRDAAARIPGANCGSTFVRSSSGVFTSASISGAVAR